MSEPSHPNKGGMNRLWAPWRHKFLSHPRPKGCIFCQRPKSRNGSKALIVSRGREVYTILNLYPYNNGHLMIAPYRHLKNIGLLSQSEILELFQMANRAIKKLDKTLKPHGYNIGFNIGRAAGAGFDKHIHLHIVPRWSGDTNFMPVLSGTRVISESLEALRVKLTE
jgi:ATP adenylyltransferase